MASTGQDNTDNQKKQTRMSMSKKPKQIFQKEFDSISNMSELIILSDLTQGNDSSGHVSLFYG